MNKWITLIGTLFISIVFSITIKTTIVNPYVGNILISGFLGLLIIGDFGIFYKSDEKKSQKYLDGFTPTN